MYAARYRRSTGFNSERNTLPGIAPVLGAPIGAAGALFTVVLLPGGSLPTRASPARGHAESISPPPTARQRRQRTRHCNTPRHLTTEIFAAKSVSSRGFARWSSEWRPQLGLSRHAILATGQEISER